MKTSTRTSEEQTDARAPQLAPEPQPSARYLELGETKPAELERVFLRGSTPAMAELAGWEFRGMNQPAWARLAGIKKFVKGFEDRAAKDAGANTSVFGYNSPAVQNALTDDWITKPEGESAKRFGFYTVKRVDPTSKDNRYLHAVLLNYGEGGNGRFDPTRGLRDYLVQVDPNNPNLLLGKAFYALGPARIATNFFILERLRRG